MLMPVAAFVNIMKSAISEDEFWLVVEELALVGLGTLRMIALRASTHWARVAPARPSFLVRGSERTNCPTAAAAKAMAKVSMRLVPHQNPDRG
jgi:hypothetical protein